MPPRAKTATTATATVAKRAARVITLEYVEALKAYAELMYKGGLVPQGKKGPPARSETVAAIIEVGRDVGLPATQALAWIMIVRGRPSIWGDAAMGLILASGLLESREELYEGTPGEDDFTAVFRVKRVGSGQVRESRFSVGDAKRANLWGKEGPWTEYPERQLMWRAKGFGCRDEFPDVLCGLIFTEEALDIPEPTGWVTVVEEKPTQVPPRVPPRDHGTEIVGVALADSPEGVTDEQIDRIKQLRSLVCASRGCANDDERAAAWSETLEPFGVASALDFTKEAAATFIESLGKKHDPFTHPPQTPPAG